LLAFAGRTYTFRNAGEEVEREGGPRDERTSAGGGAAGLCRARGQAIDDPARGGQDRGVQGRGVQDRQGCGR
jgi:hypothetical protein